MRNLTSLVREGDVLTHMIKVHNDWIKTTELQQSVNEKNRSYHRTQIQYLQHERLVHLIVTCLVSILLFGSFFGLMMFSERTMTILFLVFFVLEVGYIKHYYLLENTVQAWYEVDRRWSKIVDEL